MNDQSQFIIATHPPILLAYPCGRSGKSGAAMSGISPVMALLLACLAVLVPDEVRAQGRGPSANELRQRAAVDPAIALPAKLAEMDAWLRRLDGRFSVTRMGRPGGLQDCVAIGTGAGVQCVIGLGKDNPFELPPTLTLYGMEPNTLTIRYQQIDGQGIAQGDVGKVSGNTLTFSRVQCPVSLNLQQGNTRTTNCERQIRIYAPPDGRYVLVQYITQRRVFVPPAAAIGRATPATAGHRQQTDGNHRKHGAAAPAEG